MRQMCLYCAKWMEQEEMTPMTEKGKSKVEYYCPKCTPEVKSNLRKLPWSDLYIWGEKGQEKPRKY